MEQNVPEGPITVKEFRKKNPQLKGKRIVLCDHLKSNSSHFVVSNYWIGDNARLLVCSICSKVHLQTTWQQIVRECVFAIDVSKRAEYSNWLQEAGKEK